MTTNKLSHLLLGLLLVGILSTGAFASGAYPVLISKPDYDDRHTAPEPSENGTYFITADGYPVVRDSRGDWLYVVNNASMVLMPFGDGFVWAPAAGPAIMIAQPVQMAYPQTATRQGQLVAEPSWYNYSVPQVH